MIVCACNPSTGEVEASLGCIARTNKQTNKTTLIQVVYKRSIQMRLYQCKVPRSGRYERAELQASWLLGMK